MPVLPLSAGGCDHVVQVSQRKQVVLNGYLQR